MTSSKISQALEVCLHHALQTKRPFIYVKSYIDGLKKDSTWTEAEVAEVQSEIIRALMQQECSASNSYEHPEGDSGTYGDHP